MTRAFPRDEVFLIVFLWAVFLCLTSSATEAELINAIHPHVGWRPLNMHWSNQNLRARRLFIIFSRDTVWRTVFVSCFSRCFHFYLFWSFFKRSSIHNSVGTERSLSGRLCSAFDFLTWQNSVICMSRKGKWFTCWFVSWTTWFTWCCATILFKSLFLSFRHSI